MDTLDKTDLQILRTLQENARLTTKELGVPRNTLYGWVHANRLGNLDLGAGSQTPQSAMTLNEELLRLRQQVKELEKEIRLLKKENDFLEEASAFFAASRLKSAKTKE